MGGTVPLGYRVQDRKLLVNEPEASFVRGLFNRYLELKSVPKLAREVSRQAAEMNHPQVPECIRNRYRDRPMFQDMLYKLLVNPIYIGKVRHNGEIYEGEHEPLIDVELFEAVRKQLALGAPVPKGTAMHTDTHLLTGILFDDSGDRMSPTHGKANGRRYRYYISSRVRKSEDAVPDSWRIPAQEIEKVVREQAIRIVQDRPLIASWIEGHASTDQIQRGMARADGFASSLSEHEHADHQRATLAMMFRSINLSTSSIRFEVRTREIVGMLIDDDLADQPHSLEDTVSIELPIMLRRRGNGMRIVIDSPYVQPEPDPSLIDLIARAHIYLDRLIGSSVMNTTSITEAFNVDRADVGLILPLAFLSPKMLDAILTGTQSASLTPRQLARAELPIGWTEQDDIVLQ